MNDRYKHVHETIASRNIIRIGLARKTVRICSKDFFSTSMGANVLGWLFRSRCARVWSIMRPYVSGSQSIGGRDSTAMMSAIYHAQRQLMGDTKPHTSGANCGQIEVA